jgi:hypothetical protein
MENILLLMIFLMKYVKGVKDYYLYLHSDQEKNSTLYSRNMILVMF